MRKASDGYRMSLVMGMTSVILPQDRELLIEEQSEAQKDVHLAPGRVAAQPSAELGPLTVLLGLMAILLPSYPVALARASHSRLKTQKCMESTWWCF